MAGNRGICPQCGSTSVENERINGAQTGDLICTNCKYASTPNSFKSKPSDDKPSEKS